MKKVNTQKILIYGIIIMLIISFDPIITSGISYNKIDKQIEKISNHYDKKNFGIFEEREYKKDFSYEKNKNKEYDGPENAFVCGFVTDIDTDLPIENVEVDLWGYDYEGNYWYNDSYTNSSGYYGMHTEAGYIDLDFYKSGYFSEYLYDIPIDPYETLWVNVSLAPYPPITVAVCGFIRNKDTDDPIPNADVDLSWMDNYGNWWSNNTYSNSSGFYILGAPAGQIRIRGEADGFFYHYSDWYYAGENVTFWINLSLEPIPPQTAIVCGYINDKMTGEPIEDAYIELSWRDEQGNYDYNYSHTDGYGFYKFYTQPGRIRIYAYKANYASESSEYYWIDDYQTIWINISLTYEPDETLVACGYVTDTVTLAPIKYAYVRYDWKDNDGHIYSKYTYADKAGLYTISIPIGSAQFYITCHGYLDYKTSWFDFNESEQVTWINVSLSPEITVKIEKPLPGIYIDDTLKLPFLSKILSIFMPNFKPIVIGPITIEANITQNTSGISRVDFYIDNKFHKTDSIKPYNYTWNKTAFFSHKITVIAYDNAGPLNIATVRIRKFS